MSDVLLLSGGLDSIAAWRLLGCPQAVHFAHGSAAEARERRALLWAVDQACASWGFDGVQLRGLLLPELDVQDNGYVPYRNAIFCLMAANSFPGATRIIVAQVAEWAPDKNLRFWRRLTKLMNEMTRSRSNEIDRRVKIVAPFAGLTKGQLLGTLRRRVRTSRSKRPDREHVVVLRRRRATPVASAPDACSARRRSAQRSAWSTSRTTRRSLMSAPTTRSAHGRAASLTAGAGYAATASSRS